MIPGIGTIPTPEQRYSFSNEAAFRRMVGRALLALSRHVPWAGEMAEDAVLTIVDGVPTWVVPSE